MLEESSVVSHIAKAKEGLWGNGAGFILGFGGERLGVLMEYFGCAERGAAVLDGCRRLEGGDLRRWELVVGFGGGVITFQGGIGSLIDGRGNGV